MLYIQKKKKKEVEDEGAFKGKARETSMSTDALVGLSLSLVEVLLDAG